MAVVASARFSSWDAASSMSGSYSMGMLRALRSPSQLGMSGYAGHREETGPRRTIGDSNDIAGRQPLSFRADPASFQTLTGPGPCCALADAEQAHHGK